MEVATLWPLSQALRGPAPRVVRGRGAAQAVELERGPPVLAEIVGEAFVQGVVLYLGRATVPFLQSLAAHRPVRGRRIDGLGFSGGSVSFERGRSRTTGRTS